MIGALILSFTRNCKWVHCKTVKTLPKYQVLGPAPIFKCDNLAYNLYHLKARIFLLVDLQEFFFRFRGGGKEKKKL